MVDVAPRARRRLDGARRRGAVAACRAAGCSAPTSSSRSCTGRSARTARSRACSSCSTCPTSARACSACVAVHGQARLQGPAGRRRACRRSPTCGARARWQATPDAVRAELAALGLPLFVKPARLGSSVGIVEGRRAGGARRRARDGVPARPARRSSRRSRPGSRSSARSGARRARGVAAGGDRPARGADWYDYEAKYAPGGMELVVPARISATRDAEVRRWRARRSLRVGCAGLARVDFFVDGDARAASTSSTRCRASRRRASTRSCGRRAACRTPSSATGCCALARRALSRAERAGHRVLSAATRQSGLAEQRDLGDLDALLALGRAS